MEDPDESPGPHCLPPLVHSQYYYLSVDREATGWEDEAAGRSSMAYGTLDLCFGLGAQRLGVTEKYFAAGDQRGWVACIILSARCRYHHFTFVTGSAGNDHPGMARRVTSKLFEGTSTGH